MKRVLSTVFLMLVCAAAVAQQTQQTTTTTWDPAEDDCWRPVGSRAKDANGQEITTDAYGRPEYQIDCRGSFEAGFYIGGAVDTFAGNETLAYLNPGDTGESTLREVAGIDFAYRLYGTRERLNPGNTYQGKFPRRSQLWIYGETVHGVRSKELHCKNADGTPGDDANLPACNQAADPNVPNTSQLLAIIQGATSLEAFVGVRWEFAPPSYLIQMSELDRARLYVKAQYGTINVAGGGNSADQHHLGIGALAISGAMRGSYLEVGYGKNTLFVHHEGRWKIDGFLSVDARAVPMLQKVIGDRRIRPFAQLTVDVDFAGGADSLQTYFGLDYTFGGTR